MSQRRWLAISVGTLIVALSFWFAILTIPSNRIVGLSIFGVGLAFAMYAIAGFSGADDLMGTGFVAAITALVTAASLAIVAQTFDLREILALSPVAAIGIGGARALAPARDKSRNLVRLLSTLTVLAAMYFVFTVDVTTYGLMAPLVILPALGIADRLYERGREVIDED